MSSVDHPKHYNSGSIEVIDVIEAFGLGFCLGNTIKYICRAGKKPGASALEDLQKAAWYLNHELERLSQTVPLPPLAVSFQVSLTAQDLAQDFTPTLRVGTQMVVCPRCHINTTMTRDIARWRCDRCKGVICPGDPGFDLVTRALNPASQQPKDAHEKY